jgi:hypothetical protein
MSRLLRSTLKPFPKQRRMSLMIQKVLVKLSGAENQRRLFTESPKHSTIFNFQLNPIVFETILT